MRSKNKTEIYETKIFSIHYSKTGVHIVPRKEM
ncbi:polymorphic toxin type 50 domain-containing protein [uncultured Sneathia sp.]